MVNKTPNITFKSAPYDHSDVPQAARRLIQRVRRAWRVTSSVQVRWPGYAEPKARRRARASS